MSHIARGGFKNEDWVARQFNDRASPYGTAWLKIMGHAQPEKICAQTTRKMGFFNKADVLVLVGDMVEWVSVKKFTANFNQIDKQWVGKFAEQWKMPDMVSGSLRMYCGEEGHRPSRTVPVHQGRAAILYGRIVPNDRRRSYRFWPSKRGASYRMSQGGRPMDTGHAHKPYRFCAPAVRHWKGRPR